MQAWQALIVAHQGGWDEMLLVAAPIALFVVLLRLANRRADALGHEAGQAAERQPAGHDDHPDP